MTQVDSSEILGHGSHGTVVYRGVLHGRAVAVKRILLEYIQVLNPQPQTLNPKRILLEYIQVLNPQP